MIVDLKIFRHLDGPWRTTAAVSLIFLMLAVSIPLRGAPAGKFLGHFEETPGMLAAKQRLLPEAFSVTWDSGMLAGVRSYLPLGWTNGVLWLAPLRLVNNGLAAFNLAAGAMFFVLFLRRRGLGTPATIGGGIIAFWLGKNGTLFLAGGLGLSASLAFCAAALWLAERMAPARARVSDAVLFGAAIALCVVEGRELGMALAVAPCLYVAARLRLRVWRLWPALLCAGLWLALPVREWTRGQSVFVSPDGQSYETKDAAMVEWHSGDPREWMNLFAPGFMGRSPEDFGPPCWGSFDTNASIPKSKYTEHRLDSPYLGVLALLLAGWGIAAGWRRPATRHFTLFWMALGGGALAISCGSRWPGGAALWTSPTLVWLYEPSVGMRLVQWAVAILAAIGLDALATCSTEDRPSLKWSRVMKCLAVALALISLVLLATWPWQVEALKAAGWTASKWGTESSSEAAAIVRERIVGLACAACMAWIGGWLFWAQRRRKTIRRVATWTAVACLFAEAWLLTSHYVRPAPTWPYVSNPVLDEVINTPMARVAMVGSDPLLAEYLVNILPFFGVASVHLQGRVQLDADYAEFMDAIGEDAQKIRRLAGVSHVLAWPDALNSMQAHPESYDDLESLGIWKLDVNEISSNLGLFAARNAPRESLVATWTWASPADALTAVKDASFVPLEMAILSKGQWSDPKNQPKPLLKAAGGRIGILHHDLQETRLTVQTDGDTVVRISEKFDPDWKAEVNGEPAEIFRCDYLFQGLIVEAGTHEVSLRFRPGWMLFAAQWGGILLMVWAAAFQMPVFRKRWKVSQGRVA